MSTKKNDKRSETSAENGKKGGRPKSEATIRAQFAREYISKRLEAELEPIVDTAIKQAKKGDKFAREWLSDRAWGKATQPISGLDDEPLFEHEHKQKARSLISALIVGATGKGGQAGD